MTHPTNQTPFGTGLIVRQHSPVNLESPFDQLDSFLTPNELFYIRSHFPTPSLRAEDHVLRIEGDVRNSFTISMDELRKMPSQTRPVTLECAGNGRVFLAPSVEGAQWEFGAVGTAEWTGVPLSALLERAGLAESACEAVFEGADRGQPKITPAPPGEVLYARSVPIALKDDILIAYQMNGEDIPPDHGFPLRAIVPRHFGMASVKWLTKIRIVSEPFQGYWQTADYGYWAYENELPVLRPLGAMVLKSSIARPRIREVVKAGEPYTVFGAAWAGELPVAQVEISADGGVTWVVAEIIDESRPGAWQRWKFEWQVPTQAGSYRLMSRARDSAGNVQPSEHDKSFGTYVIHHTIPVEVFVK
jgi:DMSO/TMAO reductase YedYZ molybdopterin-dependent catalytic subunit